MKSALLTISLSPELRRKVKEMAKKENRNISNMTVVLIERGMKEEKAANLAG